MAKNIPTNPTNLTTYYTTDNSYNNNTLPMTLGDISSRIMNFVILKIAIHLFVRYTLIYQLCGSVFQLFVMDLFIMIK